VGRLAGRHGGGAGRSGGDLEIADFAGEAAAADAVRPDKRERCSRPTWSVADLAGQRPELPACAGAEVEDLAGGKLAQWNQSAAWLAGPG
jgi:hypothetical protein